MSETPADTPATSAGTTRAAGEGVDDAAMEHQVADATDSNLETEGAFEREADGAATDTEIAKADGDELA